MKSLEKNENLNVRVKFSWFIANLCDSIRNSSWIQESNNEIIIELILMNLNFGEVKVNSLNSFLVQNKCNSGIREYSNHPY
jgi:hypothetical protein